MNAQLAKLKTIISDLARVTEAERNAIAKRAFDAVAEMADQKETLLSEFETLSRELGESDLTESLIQELDKIRAQADENATILKAAAEGARSARARLQSLRESELKTGMYGADGAAVKNPNASTFASKA
ncbi:hypothetical protein PUV54_16480 [Hyphococcus flavus]|uniref:Uncharacterized protein n=1 Tax=Hyphococcus flavus TaxID=1866326 RepID=A0AAE9ZBG8_9PROT|nr:hypothetical protein [Hyphococcus flavus]WDI31549.1 hypothetical protein PUV54_16480 [Hyphococcus flavus]